jgi:hypothetical protein
LGNFQVVEGDALEQVGDQRPVFGRLRLGDDETGFGPIVRSTRITKADYIFGRFLGAFAVAAVCMLLVPTAISLGALMPWTDPASVGPIRLADYLYAYFVIALPNLLVHSAVLFALATITRSMMATYLGVVFFVRGFSCCDADQTPIAPGKKVSNVTRNGRRTARFVSTAPTDPDFSVQSARYAEKHRQYRGVDLAVYYHPRHRWNVGRMLEAMAASLDYYQANFGPYQFDHFRIVEFPAYRGYAQAFAGTIAFSESVGFIAEYNEEDTLDSVTGAADLPPQRPHDDRPPHFMHDLEIERPRVMRVEVHQNRASVAVLYTSAALQHATARRN